MSLNILEIKYYEEGGDIMFNPKNQMVRDYVEKLAAKPRLISFYATEISNSLSITIEESFEELNKLVKEGILNIKYEIRTIPGLDKIETVTEFQKIIGKKIEYDGMEYIIMYENIFPVYFIDENFKDYLKNTKKSLMASP